MDITGLDLHKRESPLSIIHRAAGGDAVIVPRPNQP
jgi:hypothetical protein